MGIVLERLAKKKLLVSDGAWGTMLHAAGLTSAIAPEEWNASHPDAVRAVAAAYDRVGCDIVRPTPSAARDASWRRAV